MLPFLKRKESQVAGLITKTRTPDEKPQDQNDESEHSEAAMACAKALLTAVESKDVKGIADAMYDAFAIFDSEPHVEGDHISPHSFDAQNRKAAE